MGQRIVQVQANTAASALSVLGRTQQHAAAGKGLAVVQGDLKRAAQGDYDFTVCSPKSGALNDRVIGLQRIIVAGMNHCGLFAAGLQAAADHAEAGAALKAQSKGLVALGTDVAMGTLECGEIAMHAEGVRGVGVGGNGGVAEVDRATFPRDDAVTIAPLRRDLQVAGKQPRLGAEGEQCVGIASGGAHLGVPDHGQATIFHGIGIGALGENPCSADTQCRFGSHYLHAPLFYSLGMKAAAAQCDIGVLVAVDQRPMAVGTADMDIVECGRGPVARRAQHVEEITIVQGDLGAIDLQCRILDAQGEAVARDSEVVHDELRATLDQGGVGIEGADMNTGIVQFGVGVTGEEPGATGAMDLDASVVADQRGVHQGNAEASSAMPRQLGIVDAYLRLPPGLDQG